MKLCADRLLIRLQCLTLAGIIVMQALGKEAVASRLFTLTFVFTFALWLVRLAGGLSKQSLLAIMLLIASGISVSANALLSGTVVSFSYMKKLIMFWSTLVCFAAVCEYRPTEKDIRFVFQWNAFLACFLTAMYFAGKPQMYLLGGRVSAYLTFRFTNPNLAGVFLAAICMIEAIHAAAAEKYRTKLSHFLLAGMMAFFAFQTQSRNAQLLLLFFFLFFTGKRSQMNGRMAAWIVMLPFLFALGYLLLVYTPAAQMLFSFLIGEGKDLDSRVKIWQFALNAFSASPFFGAYSEISGGTGTSQMHNSHLDILASYGAPVFGLFCVFLVSVLRDNGARKTGCLSSLCRIGFSALLLSGIGEAMLFSGGMGIYLFAGVLRMLANSDLERCL